MCGKTPAFGIDRPESKANYSTDNAAACCTTCNMMKHVLPLAKFYQHIFRIHNWTAFHVLQDVGSEVITCAGKKESIMLSARKSLNGPIEMVFSSASSAEMIAGGCQKMYAKHARQGSQYRQYYWTVIDKATYKAFTCGVHHATEFIKRCRSLL